MLSAPGQRMNFYSSEIPVSIDQLLIDFVVLMAILFVATLTNETWNTEDIRKT